MKSLEKKAQKKGNNTKARSFFSRVDLHKTKPRKSNFAAATRERVSHYARAASVTAAAVRLRHKAIALLRYGIYRTTARAQFYIFIVVRI